MEAEDRIFGFSEGLPALREKLRRFMDDVVIPLERPAMAHDLDAIEAAARELRAEARDAGLYAPQLPPQWGGLGLSHQERAVAFPESVHLLHHVGELLDIKCRD